MSRIIYVNGRYVPYAEAKIHVEDRGFQFADAVYEVCQILDGCLVDEPRHLKRLTRSLNEISIPLPLSLKALGRIMRETIRRNHVKNGLVYVQISRGRAPRDFVFPTANTPATIICIARSVAKAKGDRAAMRGIKVKTFPDIRWKRPDIKTVLLLPSVLARQSAKESGASEAWLVDEMGYVTEGAASNAWIVDANTTLITRPCDDHAILRGITRTVVLELCQREGIEFIERAFTVEEAKSAREAFVTGASTVVMPVIEIDKTPIGDGKPGDFTLKLRRLFHTQAEIAQP